MKISRRGRCCTNLNCMTNNEICGHTATNWITATMYHPCVGTFRCEPNYNVDEFFHPLITLAWVSLVWGLEVSLSIQHLLAWPENQSQCHFAWAPHELPTHCNTGDVGNSCFFFFAVCSVLHVRLSCLCASGHWHPHPHTHTYTCIHTHDSDEDKTMISSKSNKSLHQEPSGQDIHQSSKPSN